MKYVINLLSFAILTVSTLGITYLYKEDKTISTTSINDNNIIAYVDETTTNEITEEESTIVTSLVTEEVTTITTTSTSKTTTKTTTNNIPSFIVAENNVSFSLMESVYKEYLKVPSNIRESFQKSRWKIVIVSSSLNKRFGYKYSIQAITVYAEKTIYIDNKTSSTQALIHEIGHYINYKVNWADECDEFINIFNEEKNTFVKYTGANSNNTNTTIEYFAESYYQYIINPTKLQKNCPKTYAFLKKASEVL